MKTRKEAVAFVKNQLSPSYKNVLPKPHTHHYGRQELRELLDFLFDGPPQTDEQKLTTN